MKHVISFLLYILPLMSLAQNTAKEDNTQSKITREASFPGGLQEWRNYIEKTMASIEIDTAAWDGKTTTLMVSFIIEKDGSVSGVSVLNANKYPSVLVRETIAIIESSPKWLPALKKGILVRSYLRQPVIWKEEDE